MKFSLSKYLNLGIVYNKEGIKNHRTWRKIILNPILRGKVRMKQNPIYIDMEICGHCIYYEMGYCKVDLPEWAESFLVPHINKRQVTYEDEAYNCLCYKRNGEIENNIS
jgi:hypothetical protein